MQTRGDIKLGRRRLGCGREASDKSTSKGTSGHKRGGVCGAMSEGMGATMWYRLQLH